jgi:hypothetical protein
VADNDLALGKFIDHLSHSSIWKESAVFVLEDDAQNGPDHVDAHRSIAFVAGGFVKRHFVDHTMYSTTSMVRTVELILGLPPMSQYDAAATPMWRCFTDSPDQTAYAAHSSNIDLSRQNIAFEKNLTPFDLTHPDDVPDREFALVLWRLVKGELAPLPPVTRSGFVKTLPSSSGD